MRQDRLDVGGLDRRVGRGENVAPGPRSVQNAPRYYFFFRGSSAAFTYVIANGPIARTLTCVGPRVSAK